MSDHQDKSPHPAMPAGQHCPHSRLHFGNYTASVSPPVTLASASLARALAFWMHLYQRHSGQFRLADFWNPGLHATPFTFMQPCILANQAKANNQHNNTNQHACTVQAAYMLDSGDCSYTSSNFYLHSDGVTRMPTWPGHFFDFFCLGPVALFQYIIRLTIW